MTIADSPSVTEHAIADETGIARGVLARLRSSQLEPGEDFANVSGRGITYTPAGLEKIRAAIAPLLDGPPKKIAPPPQTWTLVVQRISGNNGRTCLCLIEDGTTVPRRAWVRVPGSPRGARTLAPRMRLEGCTRSYDGNDELFDYHGPVPVRLGLPLPEKKEAAV